MEGEKEKKIKQKRRKNKGKWYEKNTLSEGVFLIFRKVSKQE